MSMDMQQMTICKYGCKEYLNSYKCEQINDDDYN